jgi:hypothetical protein
LPPQNAKSTPQSAARIGIMAQGRKMDLQLFALEGKGRTLAHRDPTC